MKILKSIIFFVFSLIATMVLSIAIFISIALIQSIIFTPNDYLIWVVKFPVHELIFIYVIYIILIFLYVNKKGLLNTFKQLAAISKNTFLKKKRRVILPIFVILNIFLLYTIIFNVTVITNNKIIDYSFFSPLGKIYSYHDVVKINTGVYGNESHFPFTHSVGDFFYTIELNDGTKINLNETGGNENEGDEYSIIEKIDKQFVKINIPKVSSMENFKYTTGNLDKIYTDKIRKILENTRNNN